MVGQSALRYLLNLFRRRRKIEHANDDETKPAPVTTKLEADIRIRMQELKKMYAEIDTAHEWLAKKRLMIQRAEQELEEQRQIWRQITTDLGVKVEWPDDRTDTHIRDTNLQHSGVSGAVVRHREQIRIGAR